MKNIIIQIIIFGILLTSCSESEVLIEGDLYFKLIDFGNFYEVDEEKINEFKLKLDSLRLDDDPSHQKMNSEFIGYYDKLDKYGLSRSPYIFVKNDTIVRRVFLSEEAYNPLKEHSRKALLKKGKKVRLTIRAEELEKGLYYSDKIDEIDVLDGKTEWKK